MKRNWVLAAMVLAVAFVAVLLAGCGQTGTAGTTSGKKQVLCTTFPQYDWARQVIGDADDNIELSLLVDDGVDMHSYQPTVADIAKVGASDLFVYVGGESDAWVEDALKNATNKDLRSINLLEALGSGVREEQTKEGMQTGFGHEHSHDVDHEHDEAESDDHDHDDHDEAASGNNDHDHDHDEAESDDHDHDGDHELDEHVWLSLRNAKTYVGEIESALAELDPEHAETFHQNADAYRAKLDDLDARYQAMVAAAPKKTILFGDRFPFRYLVDDYGIDYYAAFEGCSAETEASFNTVAFLSRKLDELGLGTVLVIDGSDQRLAQTIIQNTKDKNQKIRIVDSLQAVSAEDAKSRTYLDAMEDNLQVLSDAMA